MIMKTHYKHIYFEEYEMPRRKTKSFVCRNMSEVHLGVVKWHAGWRQYCFFPAEACVFSKSCLEDVNHFITQLMKERKK